MKMSKKWTSSILFGWVVVAGVIGCAEKEYGSTEEMFADLPRYALEEGQKLPIDLIGAFVREFAVCGPYLVTSHAGMLDYGLGIYDLRTGELVKKAAFHGDGPDEYNIVTSLEPFNDSVFYISTNNGKNHVAFYNLHHLQDEEVFRPFYYIDRFEVSRKEKEALGEYGGSMLFPVVCTPDTTLVSRAYEATRTKMLAVYNPREELPRYCIDYPFSTQQAKEDQLHPAAKYAMYQSFLGINDRGDKVFNVFISADIIHFYRLKDGELKPYRQYEYSATSAKTDGNSYGMSAGKSGTYHQLVHWHDGRVYVLSNGGLTYNERRSLEWRQSDRMEQGEKEETFMKMLVFSDEGKPLHTLYLDVNPDDFRFSGDTLYVLRTNGLGDREILSYNMRNMKPLEESSILLAKRDRG